MSRKREGLTRRQFIQKTTLAAGAANSITLNNAANDFSTVGVTTGLNVSLTDANARYVWLWSDEGTPVVIRG